MDYQDFIKQKTIHAIESGFEISEDDLNPMLFPFQKFIVRNALRVGKYALFEDCGLGKTIQQLEFAYQVVCKIDKPSLIMAPLGVSYQTIEEGAKFGYNVVRYDGFETKSSSGVYITNYEQVDKINADDFGAIILDESSILKNFTGKIKTKIVDKFRNTPYKLACTATPSPNDHMELGNHSDFLDVMPSNEMLARFFINDTMHFGSYRLKKHGEDDFWEWVATWAMCISSPSDIGFPMDGYDLPPLNIFQEEVIAEKKDNGLLFNETAVNATTFHKELKLTLIPRMDIAVNLAKESKEPFIIWIEQDKEGDYIRKIAPGFVEVKGKDKPEVKESRLLGFAKGEFRVMVTKGKIAMFGLNYQSCNNQIIASLDFSFEKVYQMIRRSYRFGQGNPVNVWLITTDTMKNVLDTFKRKEKQFNDMKTNMNKAISKVYLDKAERKRLKIDFDHKIEKGKDFEVHLGDCVDVLKTIKKDSIDFSIFSPPFSSLYIYSDSVRDMGNCVDDDAFFEQFRYLVKEMKRVIRPGRLVAVHCKNLVNYMSSDARGQSGQRDFRGDIIRAFKDEWFSYHAEVTIWKDPVIEMQRTKAHGLLYKQLRADSSFTRTGMAEYLLVFRKWADESNEGDQEKINWKTQQNFKLMKWQDYASPVWKTEMNDSDYLDVIAKQAELIDELLGESKTKNFSSPVWEKINQTNVLNKQIARDGKDEKHICPLQLDVIEKSVELWTNPGDIVLSPFGGIGSEGFQAVKMGRKSISIELKESYFNINVKNHKAASQIAGELTLF